MMISMNFQLVVYYITIILNGRFAGGEAQIQYSNHQNQSQGTSRDVYYITTFDQDISRRGTSSTELPVTFKAPEFGSQNFWNYEPKKEQNRRTFFEDFKYLNYGNRNIFPNINSFFEFMSPFIDRESTVKPKQRPLSKLSEPYKYEYPFKYLSSTEKNFLPPPKPLRASIVKLETVTKLPDWQYPYEYITPQDYPEQVSQFQNQKPNGQSSSSYIDELGFNSNNNINFRKDSNWLSKKNSGEIIIPIFEDSGELETTTLGQISAELNFTQNSTSKIGQEPVKNNQSNFNLTTLKNVKYTAEDDVNPHEEHVKHTDFEEDSKRILQRVINNTVNKYSQIHSLNINNKRNNDQKSESNNGTVVMKNTKPYKQNNTIKIVTDLTLQGLQISKKEAVNVPRYTKFLNMTNLINYELNKIKKNSLMKPRSDNIEKIKYKIREYQNDDQKESYINAEGYSNDNDELSLDLKILKDTNWDGFLNQSVNIYSHNTNVNNLELTSEADTNWVSLDNENNSSNILNMQNSSIQTSINNIKNNHNKTIIVETRVTKSVSKILPEINRNIHEKMNQNNKEKGTRKEKGPTQDKNFIDKNEHSNVETNVMLNETSTNAKGNNTNSVTDEIATIYRKEKDKRFNRTVNFTKTLDDTQEYSSGDNEAADGLNPNYHHIRRKYRPFLKNQTSNNSSMNVTETTSHSGSIESLNSSNINEGKINDEETSRIIESSQSEKLETPEGQQIRRKKSKKTKSKRRRTNKRRKISTTTEETRHN